MSKDTGLDRAEKKAGRGCQGTDEGTKGSAMDAREGRKEGAKRARWRDGAKRGGQWAQQTRNGRKRREVGA
ncbi:hypothetical protein DENSPDRAFT_845042 [Dentipellis sp. KUC8613]|nr:hypothetical protein DENSPDRAFT_845042 [Dentipellis sp. KUC8613]